MGNAFFVLTGFSTGPRKAEKPAFPMPAIGCSHRLYPLSRHTQRGFTKMAHSAAVGSGHHRTTGNCKPSHRQGVWTTSTSGSVRPPGSERETHRNPWGMQNMAPRRRYLTAHQYRNYQPTSVYKTLYIGQETAHHQGDSNDEAP